MQILTETLIETPQPPPSSSSSPPQQQPQQLRRTLSLLDIILYGVGCSVGAGIYSLVGIGAATAGPAISLSFFLCGIACAFTSLAYAEFAARIPVAGSAYTYTYLTFGEVWAWGVGWNLTLGYGVSSAVVARSWAGYFVDFLKSFGLDGGNYGWDVLVALEVGGGGYTCSPLAMVIVGACTVILITGAKESTRFNSFMTILNLSVLFYVLLAGWTSNSVHEDNLTPFLAEGWNGVAGGAGLVFFAYLGFDMVACLSEEVSNPQRDMPRGIVGSLVISMMIYVAVSLVVVGMTPIPLLGEDVPVTNALLANGCCSHEMQLWDNATDVCLDKSGSHLAKPVLFYSSRLVSFGALFGLTTATFTCLMGQPRIFYRMAHDGLLFEIFAKVDDTTGVPVAGTAITGILVGLVACFVDLEALANMISLGTLQVFTFVNAGVIVLRVKPMRDAALSNGKDNDERTEFARSDSSQLLLRRNTSSASNIDGLEIDLDVTYSKQDHSTTDNTSKAILLILIFTTSILILSIAIAHSWNTSIIIISSLISIISSLILYRIPKTNAPCTFACPCVPLIPLAGIACNVYMMGNMPLTTWLSITCWLACGALLYCTYGRWHSRLNNRRSASASSSSSSRCRGMMEDDTLVESLVTGTPTTNSTTTRDVDSFVDYDSISAADSY